MAKVEPIRNMDWTYHQIARVAVANNKQISWQIVKKILKIFYIIWIGPSFLDTLNRLTYSAR